MKAKRYKITSVLWVAGCAAVLAGCTPRAYVVSPASADREARAAASDRFRSPSAVAASSGAPDKVPSPEDKLVKAGSKPAATKAASSVDFTAAIDAEGQTTRRAEEAVGSVREAAPTEIAPSTHMFSGNETEHVNFSKYNPFGSSDAFELELDGLAYTYPIAGKFSSGYGARGRSTHSGVDLVAPASEPIYAVFDGTVRLSKPYSGYGNVIVLRHANGLETVYAHNSKNLVRVGQEVKSGDKIALCGRTGRATTDHCHFEVRVQGATINPTLLLDVQARTLQKGVLRVSRSSAGAISARRIDGKGGEPEVPVQNEKVLANSRPVAASSAVAASPTPEPNPKEEAAEIEEQPKAVAAAVPASVGASKGIRVGDQVYEAPKSTAKSASTSSAGAVYHTVAKGETLSQIALKYKTTWQAISKVNGWTPQQADRINAGDKIRVK